MLRRCFGAAVSTFDSDKIGFQLTVCQQTGCHMEELESWFDGSAICHIV